MENTCITRVIKQKLQPVQIKEKNTDTCGRLVTSADSVVVEEGLAKELSEDKKNQINGL